jgi:FMN-dependent NADH-azoreductase
MTTLLQIDSSISNGGGQSSRLADRFVGSFRYTESGPQGLLAHKKVHVFAAGGGLYSGTALDTQTGYARDFLRFLGMTDVEFVYAEALAISPESRATSLAKATAEAQRLAA